MIWEATVVVKEKNGSVATKSGFFNKKADAESYLNGVRIAYGNLLGSAIVQNKKQKETLKQRWDRNNGLGINIS